MGITERKEREKLEMQERIVREATIMFAEVGYEGTSIRAIADRIEYSPATIYLYFKDKDELLLAVQEASFLKLLQAFEHLAEVQDPFLRLKALGFAYLKFAFDHPQLYNLMFTLKNPMRAIENQDHPKWRTGMRLFDNLRQTVAACVDNGAIPPGDPTVIAMTVWSHVHGMVALNDSCRLMIFEQPEEQVREMMVASLHYMISLHQKP